MTAPRTGLFQRKGGSAASSNTTDARGGGTDPSAAGDDSTPSQETAGMATCPECGCQFDPSQPDAGGQPGAMPGTQGMPGDAGSELGAQIAAMMQGGK